MFNFTSKIGTLEGPDPGQNAGLLDVLLLMKIKQFAIEQNLIRDRMTLTHRFSLIFKLLQITAKNPARGVFFSVVCVELACRCAIGSSCCYCFQRRRDKDL